MIVEHGRRLLQALAGCIFAFGALAATAQGSGTQPPGVPCVVTAGNRNAPLAPDGSYTVFGIPGNLGAIRARATCADGSIGQSEAGFTDPLQSVTIELGPIAWGRIDPVPIGATLSAPERYLSTGETSQLQLTAVGADGTAHDATPRSAGTVYTVSNDLMAIVTEDGLVTIFPDFAAGSSARVVASATTEGSVSSTWMFVLGPRGTLAGQVLRADGATPVANAQVSVLRLQPMEQAGTAVTDAAGRFELDDVNAGAFLVTAIDPASGDRAQATSRIETEGQQANVTLRLNGQGGVNVTVVGAADTPVANAEVTYTALGGHRDVRTLSTNAQGVAAFAGVPAGDFTVSTRDPATRLVGTAVAALAVGQTLPVTLRLQPVGQIQGRVFDVDGTTLRPGTQVRILSRERGIVTQSVVGADAAFRFDTLPISDGPFTLDAFVDGRLRARVPGIVISQPNETVLRDIVLGPVGTVTGYVKDAAGATFANARVTMQSLVGLRLSFDAVSDAAGRFVLPAVPVGGFTLTAVTPQGRSGRVQGAVAADGDTVQIDVVLANNTLIGTVYERDGATPAGAGVVVYLAPRALGLQYSYDDLFARPGNSGILRTTTDAQGRFGFAVGSANAYYVQAEQSLERGRSEVVVVNLDPSQPLQTRVVFLAKGRVAGTVRDPAGTLQPDVAVVVRTQGAFPAERTTRTDAQGGYALDGVFAGDVVVVARNEATQLAGVGTGRLDTEGQVVPIDVTLAATGTIEGRVLRRDGSVVPGPVRIVARRAGYEFAARDFPNGASYRLELVPIGEIELIAEETGNGDKGVATTRIASAGDTRTLDVRLVGQGRLRIHAVDEAGAAVAGARVTVSTLRPFPSRQEALTDASGNVAVERVFAGDYVVAANKPLPIGALSGEAAGTLLPGTDIAVEVTLTARAIGRIHGVVYRADGVTPVGAGMAVRMLPEPYPNAYVAATDADGAFAFERVEAGTYAIDALNFFTPDGCPQRDRVRGRASNVVLTNAGEDVAARVQLIGSGRIAGTITNPQGQPAAGIAVSVTNPDPIYGANATCSGRTTYDRVTDVQGRYAIDDAPPGDFTITAENTARTLRAEGAGRVRFDGDAATVDLVLVDSAVTMPRTFYDANGFLFDVAGNGSITTGHGNVFGAPAPDTGAMRLEIVKDGVAVPFTNGNGSIGRLSPDGQEIVVDDLTPSGLSVTRRVYVPRAGYFTRYIETLRNDSAAPVTVSVRVKSHQRPADSNPRVVDSSDGDQVLSVLDPAAPDRWVVVDDQYDGDPFERPSSTAATGYLFDGQGGAARVGSAVFDLIGQTGRLVYEWRAITVQPGERVALMHFAFNELDRVAAREAATRLAQLPPEAIEGLTTDERRAIRNFAVPDESALPALPNLDAGIVEGHVYSGDGVTAVPGARVRFVSKHPLFGRVRYLDSGADGGFRYRSTLDGTAANYVIPVHGFELSATHPRSAAATALTHGEFDAGTTQETQDLIFINKGDVRGTVKRHNGALVAGARVILCRYADSRCNDEQPNPVNYDTSGADGGYLMTANTPRDYFLVANKPHPQSGQNGSRDLIGRATVTITAGDTAVADIALEDTGSISGIVRAADGTPVVNAFVDLALGEHGVGGIGRSTRADTAGRYRLFDVPTGPHRVIARDAISAAEGHADVTVSVDIDTVQDIQLGGFGAVTVHVNYARGTPAGGSYVTPDSTHGGEATDTNGIARFDLPEGAYRFTARHPDHSTGALWGYGEAQITQSGQQVEATITLQPAGAVIGTIVRPDGTTLAGGFPYTITQIRGGAETRGGFTGNTGAYRVAGLPVGGYVITAYDAQQDRFADAEFAIAQDGEDVTVNLTLLDNRIALPAPLHDANRFVFDVQRNGTFASGSGAYAAGYALSVNGEAYTGDSSARLEASRRQFAITQPSPLSGLVVTRKVYVPRGAYFARYIEVLENPNGAPVTASVALTSRYAGGGIFATSSGDAVVTAQDRWAIVDDTRDADILLDSGQIPASAHVFAAANGAGAPDAVDAVTLDGKPQITQRWSALTIPAHGRVSLLHFAVQQINRAGARAAVERLVALPPEALAQMSADEQASIANFAVPADFASTLDPLPPLTASVGGIVYEGDARTPVRGAFITVQSSHPLFNRTWGREPDPFFCPPGTGVASLRSVSVVPPNLPNPPPPGRYVLQGQLTATDSIALPEGVAVRVTAQEASECFSAYAGHPFTHYPSRVTTPVPSATQDVIYDTAVVTGTVTGDPNHSITGGRVYRSIDDPDTIYGVSVPIAADATFVYPGLPTGTYDFLFDAVAPNATSADGKLRGARANVAVTAGRILVADITMQPTGTVDGTIVTANGEAARNARVVLRGEAANQAYDQCAAGCVPATLAKHKGKRVVEREVRADSLGRYKFVAVPTGSYTLDATDPISGGRRTVDVTVQTDGTVTVPVTLLVVGSADITVLDAGGNAVVDAYVYLTAQSGEQVAGRTDVQGKLTIANIPQGAYTLRVRDPRYANTGGMDRRVAGSIETGGERDTYTVNLLAAAKVQAGVIDGDNGNAAVAGARVTVVDALGTRDAGTTNAQGRVDIEPVVQGDYEIRARATIGGITREAQVSGAVAVADDGHVLTQTIDLRSAAVPLPQNLYDANANYYTIGRDGGDYQQAPRLIVGGVAFTGATAGVRSLGGRQYVIAQADPIAGLNVTRQVFVPRNGYFSRYVEILENRSAAPVTVNVTTIARTPSGNGWWVNDTGSGDSTLDATDRWVSVSTFTRFAWTYVTSAAGGTLPLPQWQYVYNAGYYDLSASWNQVTVPAGQRVALLHFVAKQDTLAGGRASAERLSQLPPEALDGIEPALAAAIGNFAVPADGTSTLPPLPALEGRLTGRVLEGDGVTPVPSTRLYLHTEHPLFGRTVELSADASGAYELTGRITEASTNIAVPVDAPLTIIARHPASNAEATATATFDAVTGTAEQNVQFADAGFVQGIVSGAYLVSPPYSGRVGAYTGTTRRAEVNIAADGTFRIGGLATGTYRIHAELNVPDDELIGEIAAVSVTAGAGTAVEVVLPPNGAVTGRLLSTGGTPLAYHSVRLSRGSFYRSVYANDLGVFTMPAVPVGSYTLSTVDGETGSTVSAEVVVRANQTTTQDLRMPGFGTVTITAHFARGAIAPDITLYLTSPTVVGQAYLGRTDAQGKLNARIGVGPYTVVALHPVNSNENYQSQTPGTVAGDGELSNLDVSLRAVADLRVRVVDPAAGNVPVPLATVQYQAPGSTTWDQTTTTDANGMAAYNDRAGGTYTIRALAPDGRSGIATAVIDASVDDGEVPVDIAVSTGATQFGVLTFPDERHLFGVAANAGDRLEVSINGAPVGGAPDNCTIRAQVYSPARAQLARGYGYGASNGYTQYNELNDLRNVSAQQAGSYAIAVSNYGGSSCLPGGYRLAVSVNGTPVAVGGYEPGGVVQGRLLQPDRTTPIPDAKVRLRNTDTPGLFVERITDIDGRYVFDHVPAGFFMLASVPAQGATLYANANGYVSDTTQPVTLDLVMPATTVLNIRALRADGTPYAQRLDLDIGTNGNRLLWSATDDQGRYTYTYVGNTPVVVWLRDNNGAEAVVGEATVQPADGQTLDVPVVLGKGSVRGVVYDAAGTPRADIEVGISRATTSGNYATVMTNAQGEFLFEGMTAGLAMEVGADIPGTQAHVGRPVQIVAGQVVQQDIHLPAAGALHGTVTNTWGGAVGEAPVYVEYVADTRSGWKATVQGTTQADGTYRIDTVPSDRVLDVYTRLYVGSTERRSATTSITLGPANLDPQVDLTLPIAGSTVVLRVAAADGQPIDGYCSVQMTRGPDYSANSYGGCAYIAFLDVPPGTYTLEGEYSQGGGARPAGKQKAPPAVNGIIGPITVTVPSVPRLVEATLPIGVIKGVVRHATGEPASYVSIRVRGTGNGYDGNTDDNGAYRFVGAKQGEVTVTAEAGPLMASRTLSLTAVSVPLVVDLTLPASGSVEGTVYGSDGLPVEYASVYATDAERNYELQAETDAAGFYRFDDLPVAEVFIAATHPTAQSVVTATTVPPASETPVTVDLHFPATGSVAGKVTLPSGAPLADACVRMWSANAGPGYRHAQWSTNADGAGDYRFDATMPGPIGVQAADCSGTPVGVVSATVATGQQSTVDIEAGNATPLPAALADDVSDYVFSIERSAGLYAYNRQSWDNEPFRTDSLVPSVDGLELAEQPGARIAQSGREVVFEASMASGLAVTRRVHVPANGGYARTLVSLTNTQASAVTAELDLRGWYDDDYAVLATAPSTTGGRYAMQVPAGPLGFPAGVAAYVFGGTGGSLPPRTAFTNGRPDFRWGWTVTIPPGATASYLGYAVVRLTDAAAAQAQAQALAEATQPGMFDGLSAADKASVKNFVVPTR